jgi:hypothetical protein
LLYQQPFSFDGAAEDAKQSHQYDANANQCYSDCTLSNRCATYVTGILASVTFDSRDAHTLVSIVCDDAQSLIHARTALTLRSDDLAEQSVEPLGTSAFNSPRGVLAHLALPVVLALVRLTSRFALGGHAHSGGSGVVLAQQAAELPTSPT